MLTMDSPANVAAGILRAWERNDAPRFRSELDRASGAVGATDGWGEERAELLAAVSTEMRRLEVGERTDTSAACLGLLRHLAGARIC